MVRFPVGWAAGDGMISRARCARCVNEPSAADLPTRKSAPLCQEPSKLVMRVRFPSPALQVRYPP
jgi:hypothetical protein